jgi:hypothetical protein
MHNRIIESINRMIQSRTYASTTIGGFSVNTEKEVAVKPHKNTGVSIKKCSFTPLNYPVTY